MVPFPPVLEKKKTNCSACVKANDTLGQISQRNRSVYPPKSSAQVIVVHVVVIFNLLNMCVRRRIFAHTRLQTDGINSICI